MGLPDSWALMLHGELLATLVLKNIDQPFYCCALKREAAFAGYEALFASLKDLVERDQFEELESGLHAIAEMGFALKPDNGDAPIREFLLHIDGDTAWFRY
jgi:hypothetical protein